MKEDGKELELFLAGNAGGDPAAAAANARIAGLFAAGAAQVPEAVKRRVLARAAGAAAPAWRPAEAVRALAFGAAALMAFVLLGPGPVRGPAEDPDWRSYDNFPYYADESRMYLSDLSTDWRSPEGLQPDPRTGL
ncbi:MAG TPA: hypothetical protein PKI19_04555 [Elusimicrobiales bacterium]|nr:hypothetical protein [Elusimicrobiales bacterium]